MLALDESFIYELPRLKPEPAVVSQRLNSD